MLGPFSVLHAWHLSGPMGRGALNSGGLTTIPSVKMKSPTVDFVCLEESGYQDPVWPGAGGTGGPRCIRVQVCGVRPGRWVPLALPGAQPGLSPRSSHARGRGVMGPNLMSKVELQVLGYVKS